MSRFTSLKRLAPRTLFGRSLLILLTPLVLAQAVSAYVFFDRHWETLIGRLAYGVAGDISAAKALIERREDTAELLDLLGQNADLRIRLTEKTGLPPVPETDDDVVNRILKTNLAQRMKEGTFALETLPGEKFRRVYTLTSRGVLEVTIPEKRLHSVTATIFILWMVGSAVFFFAIAILFMRNQIKPIRRLAFAAEQFGIGREVKGFKPEGAAEVRQAAQAFIQMKERIKRQIRQRTEMLAGVSHDLRTPLTRMKLQLAVLKNEEGREELSYDIAEMERMVEGYLAFTRGEGEEESVETDLAALLASIVEDAGRSAQSPINFTPIVSTQIILRPQAIRRCLSNLIGNAQRYAKNVAVHAEVTESMIYVHVDDDGPGIPEEKRAEVLRPFVRLEDSRNPETGGVGLGLTIARDVARAHGGDILLTDSPLHGLRATLRLPR